MYYKLLVNHCKHKLHSATNNLLREFWGWKIISIIVVQSPHRVWLFVTPWTAAGHASLSFTSSWHLLKFMSIESVMPSNYLILCCPFSSCPQSFPASGSFPMSWLFASGGQSIGALALAPSNEYPVLVSTRIDWFDILVVQGTLKSLLQHHNSKPSILQHFQWSNSHIRTWLLENHSLDCIDLCQQSDVSAF